MANQHLIAASYGDPLVIFTMVLAVATILLAVEAWGRIVDRRSRKRRHHVEWEEHRLYELIGTAFWGSDKSKWPSPERAAQSKSITSTLDDVHKQVTPSNGKTTAAIVEEVRKDTLKLAVLLGEHMSDGHGGQTWPGT